METDRCQVWFDGPDEAYLVAAAIRRHMDPTVASDTFLVPTSRGPALEISAAALSDRVVQALVRRFGGHIDAEAVAARVEELVAPSGESSRRRSP